ncbi:MAG: hypothetical protein R8K21_08075 [Mariprofundales bacterium]
MKKNILITLGVCISIFAGIVFFGKPTENYLEIHSKYRDLIFVRATRGVSIFADPLRSYFLIVDEHQEITSTFLENLGDQVEWAPDEKWIVFSTLYTDGARAGGNSEIFLVDSLNSHRIQLSTYEGDDHHPTWSPDGIQIAFVSGVERIQILNIECYKYSSDCNSKPIEIAEGQSPDWSPDGKYISYAHDGSIYIIQSNGEDSPTKLKTNLHCNSPEWSQDGFKIVMQCQGDIYIVNKDGTGMVNLTNGIGINSIPRWSPNGQKITFVSIRDGHELGRFLDTDGSVKSNALFMMDIDGRNIIRISPSNSEHILWYTWIP